MENTIMINGYEIDVATSKEIEKRIKKVGSKINAISKGYLSICGDVAYFRDTKAHLITGHKNLYDLCAERFGMARGTVSNLVQIYDRWGSDYALSDAIGKRKITELLAELKELKKLEDPDAGNGGEDPGTGDVGEDGEDPENGSAVSPHAAYSFEVHSADWSMENIVEEMTKHFHDGVVKGFPEQLLPGDKITLTIN